MNAKELAAQLDRIEYPARISRNLCEQAKAAGLVIIYGVSDDLMEFRGAIDDEVGCYDGGTAYLSRDGLLQSKCDSDSCPYFEDIKASAATVEAVWNEEGVSWLYRTDIPHETFDMLEDGERYCRGIVFALEDAGPQKDDTKTTISQAAIQWLANGKRGTSSNTIFTHLTGINAMGDWAKSHPYDPDDLRRCRLLLEQVPEFKERLHEMAEVSKEWENLVEFWGDICAIMDEEAPNWRLGDLDAPKTYAHMKDLIIICPF